MKRKALPGLIGLTLFAMGRLVVPVPARAQGCSVDEPEVSVEGSFATTDLAQTAQHYYEGGVPIYNPEGSIASFPRLLQASGLLHLRDPDSLDLLTNINLDGFVITETMEEFFEQEIAAFAAQDNGGAYRCNHSAYGEAWSIYLGRTGCTDSLGDLAIQPGILSTTAFQSTYGPYANVVYVGTHYIADRNF